MRMVMRMRVWMRRVMGMGMRLRMRDKGEEGVEVVNGDGGAFQNE